MSRLAIRSYPGVICAGAQGGRRQRAQRYAELCSVRMHVQC